MPTASTTTTMQTQDYLDMYADYDDYYEEEDDEVYEEINIDEKQVEIIKSLMELKEEQKQIFKNQEIIMTGLAERQEKLDAAQANIDRIKGILRQSGKIT